jgi:hypothetical protein
VESTQASEHDRIMAIARAVNAESQALIESAREAVLRAQMLILRHGAGARPTTDPSQS